MKKLWSKNSQSPDELVDRFTVGNDRLYDMRIARFDVEGSLAHIAMLKSIELLTHQEYQLLSQELRMILEEIEQGSFKIEDDVEDIHSQVEILLTRRVGEVAKKIHSGRSRNDQVLTDIRLYLKWEIESIKDGVVELFNKLLELSEEYKELLLPGYTHTQVAMPSSFGLWFGAYAESLVDDLHQLVAAYKIVDQNPLGSAAGYGNSFPLDRELTTELLGFSTLTYNSVAVQLGRGKMERSVAFAISSIAFTLNKLASDSILYLCSNFGFISFPDTLTTGSSIMPHKKNPDIWEILRAATNRLHSIPNEISLLTTNLIHGYHRDFQLLKEILFPAIDSIKELLGVAHYMLENIKVNRDILDDPLYLHLFTVEEVNRLVLDGVPFREAYQKVGLSVEEGSFSSKREIAHTHLGSIGNLANDKIREKMESLLSQFGS
ncbi:MAG: argininosuccinate lyase [Bacteroidales bacterium]